MDRTIVYPGAIPLETDILQGQKNNMIGIAKMAEILFGTDQPLITGLACTPTTPASLNIEVAPGQIYSMQNMDDTAYSSLAADTVHRVLKQGIVLNKTTLNCPAPSTTGYSINYLIQIGFAETDSDALVLPYYNASNPAVAYSGPNNSGVAQYTLRKDLCVVAVKAGVAATTGSQTTPSPDSGFIGAWIVTVANGQATITAGNITQYPGVNLINSMLDYVLNFVRYATDTGTGNAYVIALSPSMVTAKAGMPIWFKPIKENSGAATLKVDNMAAVDIKSRGVALMPGNLRAGVPACVIWTGSYYELVNPCERAGIVFFHPGSTPRPGSLKINGAVLNRVDYPALWGFAQNYAALVTDTDWNANKFGCFSSGNGSTTFRLPQVQGDFIRAFDDGRGDDPGRVFGSYQGHAFTDHVHATGSYRIEGVEGGYAGIDPTYAVGGTCYTGGANAGAGSETRPRNVAYLACVTY